MLCGMFWWETFFLLWISIFGIQRSSRFLMYKDKKIRIIDGLLLVFKTQHPKTRKCQIFSRVGVSWKAYSYCAFNLYVVYMLSLFCNASLNSHDWIKLLYIGIQKSRKPLHIPRFSFHLKNSFDSYIEHKTIYANNSLDRDP